MADRLGDLAAPKNDPVGLQLEKENLPQRVAGLNYGALYGTPKTTTPVSD